MVLIQNCIRRWIAKKELKERKKQAKSIEHIKTLNKGLENKIISLQQKYTEMREENAVLKDQMKDVKHLKAELEAKKDLQVRVGILEKETKTFEAFRVNIEQLVETERAEKMDALRDKENAMKEVEGLREELKSVKEELDVLSKEAEMLRGALEQKMQVEAEMRVLVEERDRERVAHQTALQKLLSMEGDQVRQNDFLGFVVGSVGGMAIFMLSGVRRVREAFFGIGKLELYF